MISMPHYAKSLSGSSRPSVLRDLLVSRSDILFAHPPYMERVLKLVFAQLCWHTSVLRGGA